MEGFWAWALMWVFAAGMYASTRSSGSGREDRSESFNRMNDRMVQLSALVWAAISAGFVVWLLASLVLGD